MPLSLSRRDLILAEARLRDTLVEFLPFTAHSLYFPETPPRDCIGPTGEPLAAPVTGEGRGQAKVLIPLVMPPEHGGAFLGVFVARGKLTAPKTLSPLLPKAASLCLVQLALAREATTDPLTGLATRERFLTELTREIEEVRACALPSGLDRGLDGALDGDLAKGFPTLTAIDCTMDYAGDEPGEADEAKAATEEPHPRPTTFKASAGVLVLLVHGYADSCRRLGHLFTEELFRDAAQTLAQTLTQSPPDSALCAFMGAEHEGVLAVMVPEARRKRCRELGAELSSRVAGVAKVHPLTGEHVHPGVSLGFATFPMDVAPTDAGGAALSRDARELARIVTDKALLAARAARESGAELLGFSDILARGGKILETLPAQRFLVSLGLTVDAREAMRFAVYGKTGSGGEGLDSMYKGEIVLARVGQARAQAEILHLEDPAWPPEPGDSLILSSSKTTEEDGAEDTAHASGPDRATTLLPLRSFLARLTKRREKLDRFCLVVVKLLRSTGQPDPARLTRLAETVREVLALPEGEDGAGQAAIPPGRYGSTALICCLEGTDPDEARELALSLAERLAGQELPVAVGIAPHPFLDYPKSQAVENVKKALEYAQLLPAPHVGLLDSLALTIAADRLFAQGDLYPAMEEYKLALLADPANILARNSLGICHSRAGNESEALAAFSAAVKADPKDLMARYNLGHTRQKLGEYKEARAAFRAVLKRDPGHLFSQLRLGQIAEDLGQLAVARKHYLKAAEIAASLHNADAVQSASLISRHLARLAAKRGKSGEAREHLHTALARNPRDAASLTLLAELYLQAGEDSAVAETLARQAVALEPARVASWRVLARALLAQGKEREAREAEAKAEAVRRD